MCLYCENKKDNSHFSCVSCEIGMCEECYDSDCEHTEHLFDYSESIEDEEYYEFIQSKVISSYGYMCYNCLDKFREEYEENNK